MSCTITSPFDCCFAFADRRLDAYEIMPTPSRFERVHFVSIAMRGIDATRSGRSRLKMENEISAQPGR